MAVHIDQKVSPEHPEYEDLVRKAPGKYRLNTHISIDYTIAELRVLLHTPSVSKSKLIWQTMTNSLSTDHLQARYRNNRSQPERVRASSLVYALRNAKWVPQRNGDSFSFVQPKDASVPLLPDGFSYKVGQEWFDAIEFGKTASEQKEESDRRDQDAKNLGFDSGEKAEKYAKLDQILEEQGISPDDVISQYSAQSSDTKPDFPTSTVKNPERRKKQVLEQLENAPEKEFEERPQRRRVSKDEMEGAHRTSLQEWYTNDSGEMICQICQEEMPFKKTDGEYYFEAIEALTIRFKDDELPENHFPKEYEAQYLALCPECAARYDYFARTAQGGVELMEKLRDQLMNLDDLEVPLCLGELKTSIRFVKVHLHDLKSVLQYYENPQDSGEATD